MGKKIQLFRASGTPVLESDNEAFRTEWGECFDKAEARAAGNMKKMQRFLKMYDRALTRKHNKDIFIEWPKSIKQLQALTDKYGRLNIVDTESKGLIMVIMDLSD